MVQHKGETPSVILYVLIYILIQASLRSKFAKDTTTEYPVHVEDIKDDNDLAISDNESDTNLTKPLM